MQLGQILSIFAVVSLAVGASPDGHKSLEGAEARDFVQQDCFSDRNIRGWRPWGGNENHAVDMAGRWCSGSAGSGTYEPGELKYGR